MDIYYCPFSDLAHKYRNSAQNTHFSVVCLVSITKYKKIIKKLVTTKKKHKKMT